MNSEQCLKAARENRLAISRAADVLRRVQIKFSFLKAATMAFVERLRFMV